MNKVLKAIRVAGESDSLRAEVAALKAERDAILQEARCWALEAKTQRGTVNEVGATLGGMADWGPIARSVLDLKAERDALRAACEAAQRFLTDTIKHGYKNDGATLEKALRVALAGEAK